MTEFRKKLERSINSLEKWVEDHEYMAYEPFDGLSSPLRALTFGSHFLDRILLQTIRQSPINLRPLFGVKPLPSTKGRGYMAGGYLERYKQTVDDKYRQKALENLDWLMENKSGKFEHYTWANHFPFASRGGRYSADEPIIVWTALIGQVFLDAYELFGEQKHLDVVKSICNWIMKLPREETASGACISYHMFKVASIHNSNMLGAALLARAGKLLDESGWIKVAREAMLYSCSRQLPDGAWYYAETENMHWIDNFHTGYNLSSLKCYIDSTGDEQFRRQMIKGLDYFIRTFFEESGRPKYYHNRTYPVDSQCASQAVETLNEFSEFDERCLPLAVKVASWWIDNMQDRKGYFYYRQYPLMKAKTPMLHWSQATSYRGLVMLLSELEKEGIR
ncbi:MAG: hypothetical protein RRA15_09500 [bacterium]|nr:hypothetical protein [bacterium]